MCPPIARTTPSVKSVGSQAVQVIGFDDLQGGDVVELPSGYQGFVWESYDPMKHAVGMEPVRAHSDARALTSGQRALKGLGFQFRKLDGRRFHLDSLVLANDFCGASPASCSNNTIAMTAFRDGAVVGSLSICSVLINHGPAVIDLGVFRDVDLFRIESTAIEVFSVDDIALS